MNSATMLTVQHCAVRLWYGVQEVFDFELIKKLVTRSNFKIKFDAMHAVTGAYAKPIFIDALGAPEVCSGTALGHAPRPLYCGGEAESSRLISCTAPGRESGKVLIVVACFLVFCGDFSCTVCLWCSRATGSMVWCILCCHMICGTGRKGWSRVLMLVLNSCGFVLGIGEMWYHRTQS